MERRRLTKDEERELAGLTAAVTAAIEARRDWLDAKMLECSPLKVGDDIYDLDSGRKLGKVLELYRFWRDRDDGIRDTSYYCDYRYEKGTRMSDNTSRQSGLSYGTRADALERAERRASSLRD